MYKAHALLFWLLTLWCSALYAGPDSVLGKLPAKSTGTGRTTGHVANIEIKNKNKTTIQILAQRVFIPSSGSYQPYIVDIPAGFVRPDSTIILKLIGYCTDVNLPAAPNEYELLPLTKWIPIRQIDTTSIVNGIFLVSNHSVVPFTKDHIPYLIGSGAYKPLYPPADSLNIPTWPGTDVLTGGTLNHNSRPDLFATVISKALELLKAVSLTVQEKNKLATPFSIKPITEREAVIQNVIWMYAAALSGRKYGQAEFRNKVYEAFKFNSQLTTIPPLEKQELDEGTDEFWNLFLAVAKEAHLFISTEPLSAKGMLVDLPIDTIRYPWSVISLTELIMKPFYTKVVPVKLSSPVIPILAGSTSLGTLAFIAFHNHEEDTVDCSFTISLQVFNLGCPFPGMIDLIISPIGDYTYLWSNGATTQDIDGLSPGTYSVTVSRVGTTCTQAAEDVIQNFDYPAIKSITPHDATCNLDNGWITLEVNDIGAVTYAWSNGSTTKNQYQLTPGTYSVTVTTSNGCTDSDSTTISNAGSSFSVGTHVTSPPHCGAPDGSAIAIAKPKGEYTYLWSTGATMSSITNLLPGTYGVTATNVATGCTAENEITLTDLPVAFSIDSVIATSSHCDIADGSAMVVVDPEDSYTYTWSNGQTTSQATNLAPGTYSVIVAQEGSLCADTGQVIIEALPPLFAINITSTPANCGVMNGSAIATINPPGNYIFSWSNGQTTAEASGLGPGNYTVTVTLSEAGCFQQATTTVESLPAHYLDIISVVPDSCGLGVGNINFSLVTPGSGPLSVEILGPPETFFITTTLTPGIYSLSSFGSLHQGAYSFKVFDQSLDALCFNSTVVQVNDIVTATVIVDDIYSTLPDQPVTDNVLSNDNGTGLMIFGIDSLFGGTVNISADGVFTFTPDPGFSGNGQFLYAVIDQCGKFDTGAVVIVVQPNPPFQSMESGIHFSAGIFVGHNSSQVSPEKTATEDAHSWSSGICAELVYNLGKKINRFLINYLPSKNHALGKHPAMIQIEHQMELVSWNPGRFKFYTNGGFGFHFNSLRHSETPLFLSICQGLQFNVKNILKLQAETNISGWEKWRPHWLLKATVPLIP